MLLAICMKIYYNEIFLFRQLEDYANHKKDEEEEQEDDDNEEKSEEQILLREYCQFITKYTLKLYGLKQVNAFYASTQEQRQFLI